MNAKVKMVGEVGAGKRSYSRAEVVAQAHVLIRQKKNQTYFVFLPRRCPCSSAHLYDWQITV